jgi:dGTPase
MGDSPSFHTPARARFAENPEKSRGRLYPESQSRTRTPFARDRDRIIHCQAFRRLKEKTQVFVAHEGDHSRTRLTHSLEVAQIARSIAYALGLDSDLAETIALAHDLGHPPFGHSGEEALADRMEPFGGFDHNVQTLRVVTELERRYPAFDGLNLTWETLEGIVKHNGPVTGRLDRPSWRAVSTFNAIYDLRLDSWASAEAQVAALADDIAYNNHDVDDGLQAGLFRIDDLLDVPLIGPVLAQVRTDWPDLDDRMLRLEAVRRMIGAMVEDVLAETGARVSMADPQSADAVRGLDRALVAFSADMTEDLAQLRRFLHERMYRHDRVERTRNEAKRLLGELFDVFIKEPSTLPLEWRERQRNVPEGERARVICDYIAGMTDRYAIEEYRRLFHTEIPLEF